MATFRSIVIALKAIVLNLLSVGAAYGVLVWVFQDGHGESLLGFESNGGITSWLPLFLFVLLFGLSMDYHVFILSRIREAFDSGMSTGDAVAHGIKSTAGVVTSAAVVMIAVFSVFATLGSLDFKQMGVGLAVAVLIDATIVRAVLLPATMKLLGDGQLVPAELARLAAPRGPRGRAGGRRGLARKPSQRATRDRPRSGAVALCAFVGRRRRAGIRSQSGHRRGGQCRRQPGNASRHLLAHAVAARCATTHAHGGPRAASGLRSRSSASRNRMRRPANRGDWIRTSDRSAPSRVRYP